MPKRRRKRRRNYPRKWRAYNAAKTSQKKHFRVLLRELCDCVVQPEQLLGRPRCRLADVIFCLVYKIYTTNAGRQFKTDAEDARDLGFLRKVPHYNTLSRYYREEWLTPVLEQLIEITSLPLKPYEVDFAADATGFSTDRYARWLDLRTSEELSRKEWVKMHIMAGVRTHVVTSVVVLWGHESRFFGRLVAGTRRNFRMREVSADGAYMSGESLLHVVKAGAVPYIPFRENSRSDDGSKSRVWRRLLTMFQEEHGRFLAHYNKRNNVETVFSMIKENWWEYVRGRTERAQVNEVLAKVLCHNLCVLIMAIYELGIEPKFDAVINPDEKKELAKPEPVVGGRIVAETVKPGPRGTKGTGKLKNFDQLSLFD